MKKVIINLTSHTINETTTGAEIKPSGTIARVKTSTTKVGEHDGCPIFTSTFGEIEGLPDPKPNTLYIVSALAFNAIPKHRLDVVSPGNVQRDQNGNIVGCFGFRRG